MERAKYLSGHRDRLRERFLKSPGTLEDYELIELLLFSAIPRIDVRIIAKRLIAQFGNAAAVLAAPYEELIKIPGIGHNSAVAIKLNHELNMRRLVGKMKSAPIFHDMESVNNYCIAKLGSQPQEIFMVLYLDAARRLISAKEHARGNVRSCAVYADEIVREAAILRAVHIVLVHNHPSRVEYFSEADKEATIAIQKQLAVLDKHVYDHLLVMGGEVFSGRANFLFD